jgi:hypothetical protein
VLSGERHGTAVVRNFPPPRRAENVLEVFHRYTAYYREGIGNRPVSGSATEALQGAKEGLWMMRNDVI